VIGEVAKPGGFVLNERETMSVLQAMSLAGGLSRVAAPSQARILRDSPGNPRRQEVPVDVKRILAGKDTDVVLQPDDILFIPNSSAKSAALRAVEAAITVGTGVVIWRR
jgi:polysaccharide export outer membrane protein